VTTGQRPATLADDLRRHAAVRPADTAVVAGDEIWSWSDLDRRADGIAAAVAALALAPGERIALAVGPTPIGIATLHGVTRAGALALVVHPSLAAPEIAALLGRTACRAILIDPATGVAAPAGISVIDLSAIADATPSPATAPGELIVATSGTTAQPKLARLPLDRIAASVAAWIGVLPPAAGWLLSLGLGHVAGIGIVVRAAAAGVPIVVPQNHASAALLDTIRAARATGVTVSHLSLVAQQLAAILDMTRDASPPDGVAAVILGGGPIPAPLLRRAAAAGWPVIPSYGMTETASGVVALPTVEVRAHPESVGSPLDGVELRLDGDAIELRGSMVFAGYLDDPAATDAALTPDGWLRTGDLGRLDADGRLIVIGRSDDVIITGGEKVAPAEVEAALRSHPAIADAAVTGVADPRWGTVPVAIVVLRDGADATDDELRAHAAARLARFKVPSRIVRVSSLPRDELGKITRAHLRSLAALPSEPATPASEPVRRMVTTNDGQPLAIVELPAAVGGNPDDERPVAILLHATLSTSEQLLRLGRGLAERSRVVLVDRRGSGDSIMAVPGSVPVPRHVADVIAILDHVGVERVVLIGHSYGGVVALETAARHPDRVSAAFVWEPPYLDVAPPPVRRAMAHVGDDVARAFADGGAEAAAHRFLDTVAGRGAWERLHPRQQASIGREGTGALADAAMTGLDPDGLTRISCPVVIGSGDASERFYAPIADALAERIGSRATRIRMPDLRHPAPITDPVVIAELALPLLDSSRPEETTP
jgi:o-succinylbenzoate---CoA ligase